MVITREQVRKDLVRYCSSFRGADDFYVLPAISYLIEDFLPWFRNHLQRRRMVFHSERFDCDDFAREFAACLREAGLGLKEKAGVAVGTIQVNNKEWSLGVKAGEHMLNLVGVNTKDGLKWLIIEPQNQKYVFIEDYKTANNLRVVF